MKYYLKLDEFTYIASGKVMFGLAPTTTAKDSAKVFESESEASSYQDLLCIETRVVGDMFQD